MRELDATNDRAHWQAAPDDGYWPVYKGASLDLWNPDAGAYFGWADAEHITEVLQTKRIRQQRLASSPFSEFSAEHVADPTTLPCLRPRIAFRDITNRTNNRTVIAALVPPDVVLTNTAPYVLFPVGDERDEAYLLGVLSSMILDWYARCVVELHMNFHLFNSLPVPRPDRDDPLRLEVEQIAGRFAAVDDRYERWAEIVGVPLGGVTDRDARADLGARLDAAVARLYGLDEGDVVHIFETFHVGADYSTRCAAVLEHFRDLAPPEEA